MMTKVTTKMIDLPERKTIKALVCEKFNLKKSTVGIWKATGSMRGVAMLSVKNASNELLKSICQFLDSKGYRYAMDHNSEKNFLRDDSYLLFNGGVTLCVARLEVEVMG